MKRTHFLLLLPIVFYAQVQAQVCPPCGSGADGVFLATADTAVNGGEYNFTTFTIQAGVTVKITGNQPMIIHCTGAVLINGTLHANGGAGTNGVTSSAAGIGGTGVAGGQNGGNGAFGGTGSGPLNGSNGLGTGPGTGGAVWSGGGGGGHLGLGYSSNGAGGFGGPYYGDVQLTAITAGSGGGGGAGGNNSGGGGGGGGGGYIAIYSCVGITIGSGGFIQANGGDGGSDGNGACGGGGGGSGGTIWLKGNTIQNNGQVSAAGGYGGNSSTPFGPYYGLGGGGANGRIRLDGIVSGSGLFYPTVGFTSSFNFTPVNVTATSAPNDSICNGTTVVLNASSTGGTQPWAYTWMPGNLSGNPSVSPANTTTYTVTSTDASGCTATSTFTLHVITPPNVSISGPAEICNGNTAVLSGTGGGSVQWFLNGVAIPGATGTSYSASLPGVYNMLLTPFSGCSDSASTGHTLIVNPLPLVSFSTSADTFCVSDSPAPLSGSPAGGTYSGPGISGSDFIPLTAGIGAHDLVYNYTDGNACSNSDTVSVTVLGCTGMESENEETFTLYPNPVSGHFTISGISSSPLEVQVTDISGRTVYMQRFDNPGNIVTLSAESFTPGIYAVRITAGTTHTFRIVVK